MKPKESAQSKIRKWIKSGRSITPLIALRRFGCFRLAAVIKRFRDEGLDIETWLETPNSYAVYTLKKKR